MRRSLSAIVLTSAMAAVVLAGCSSEETTDAAESAATPTSAAASDSSTPSASSRSTTSETEAEAETASIIHSVAVELAVREGELVSDDEVKLAASGNARPLISWRAKTDDGDLEGSDCNSVVKVTGPSNFDERRSSPLCSDNVFDIRLTTPGDYKIVVSVTAPDEAAPVTGELTFTVIK